MNIEKAKQQLNAKPDKNAKTEKISSGIGWEIGAYAVRAGSVGGTAITIIAIENSWLKNGLGLMATLLIISLLLIFRKPIKSATNYAPGVIPFSIFIVLAIFFDTTAKSLFTIGISGLIGSVAAIPLHLKYLSYSDTNESPELKTLMNIIKKIK